MTPDEVEARYKDFSERATQRHPVCLRLSVDYLGLLYGGAIGQDRKRRVQGRRGSSHCLSPGCLGPQPDTRDGGPSPVMTTDTMPWMPFCVALTEPKTVKALSEAAERAQPRTPPALRRVASPWPSFYDDVKKAIAQVTVSHRVRSEGKRPSPRGNAVQPAA